MIDPKTISNGPEMVEASANAWGAGGWMVLVKCEGVWRPYSLDGDNGIVRNEDNARQIYSSAIKSPSCDAARLIRISPEFSFAKIQKS